MPRFTGQNKKNIDPRYFLNEKTEINELEKLAPGASKSDVLLAQGLSQFERKVGRMRPTFYPSVMYRILRKDGVAAAMEYLQSGLQSQVDDRMMAAMQKDLEFVKKTIDLEVGGRQVGPNYQPSKDTPFRDQQAMQPSRFERGTGRRMEEAPKPKGRMEKTDRFKEGDRVKHSELGTGRVVSRGGAHKNNVGIRWDKDGKQKPSTVDHNSLRKA